MNASRWWTQSSSAAATPPCPRPIVSASRDTKHVELPNPSRSDSVPSAGLAFYQWELPTCVSGSRRGAGRSSGGGLFGGGPPQMVVHLDERTFHVDPKVPPREIVALAGARYVEWRFHEYASRDDDAGDRRFTFMLRRPLVHGGKALLVLEKKVNHGAALARGGTETTGPRPRCARTFPPRVSGSSQAAVPCARHCAGTPTASAACSL